MFSCKQFKSGLVSFFLIYTFIFSLIIPANAQGDFVTSNKIGGGSSVYVFRDSRKAKKSNYAAKRRSTAKRTSKQRQVTRRKIVRQSRTVAKRNRVRRSIKTVTPKEFETIKVEDLQRKSKEEASKVLAGVGEYYVEKDEFETSLGFLEQAVELDENNTDAKLALSEVYTAVGDQTVEKADEYAQLAAKAVQEDNSADRKKFLTLEKFARQKAEKEFTRAIELDPKNSSAYASLGGYFDNQDEDQKAKENYEKALEIDPALSKVKAPLGIIYYQEGEIAKAEKALSEALDGGEENAEVQFFLGLIRYKQNRNEDAKKALQTSIALDSENAEAHYYLGATLNRLGEEEKAIQEYLKTTAIDPKFVNAWFDLGVAYYNKEMYQDAISSFEKAIELNVNQTDEERRIYAESFANLAETYRQTEQYGKAISKYRNAVDLINDPELYSTYGFVLVREEKWKDAVTNFEKVTQMKPDAISFANLGWTHYQESQYHLSWNRTDRQKESLLKAKEALETAIGKDDKLVAAYLNLGITLNDLGEANEAIRVLKKAVDLRKDWVFAVNELATSYALAGDSNNAIKYFKQAIKMDKNYALAIYGLGDSELARNNIKEAKKAHSQLKNLDNNLAKKLENKIRKAEFNRN
jgi:superkiller protein 3